MPVGKRMGWNSLRKAICARVLGDEIFDGAKRRDMSLRRESGVVPPHSKSRLRQSKVAWMR